MRGGAGRRVQEVHTHLTCILPARLAERIWFTKFQSSLLNVYFRLSRFQSLLLLIYFPVGIGVYTDCTKVWQKTYPICDAPLSRSAWRSLVQLLYVIEMAPNRNPVIRFDFGGGAKAIPVVECEHSLSDKRPIQPVTL